MILLTTRPWVKSRALHVHVGTMKDLGPERHNIDRDLPEEHLLARSLDGGETWALEHPAADQGMLVPVGNCLHLVSRNESGATAPVASPLLTQTSA